MKLIALVLVFSVLEIAKTDQSNYIRLSRSILTDQLNETTNQAVSNGMKSSIEITTVPNGVNNSTNNKTLDASRTPNNGTTQNKVVDATTTAPLHKITLPQSNVTIINKQLNGTASNAKKNESTTSNPNGTELNKQNIETNRNNKTEILESIMTNLTSQIPEAKKRLESSISSFNNLNFDNQTVIMKNLDFISRAANKTVFSLSPDLIKTLNGSGINTEVWKNQVMSGKNSNKNKTDLNFNPSMWMLRTSVPWKHVSEAKNNTETEIVQVCRFDAKTAICSAEYSKWNAKLWFDFAEAQGKKGINITTHERGNKPRVSFYNKVNGTDCQIFNNGTFHQICVKIYGYETDLGPTRFCLQLGAAIFNHGVASTDFGCFRFGSAVRHEYALEGEDPMPVLLNEHILLNDYNNVLEPKDDPNSGLTLSNNLLLTIIIYFITLLVLR